MRSIPRSGAVCALAVVCLLAPEVAHAWGKNGHRITSRIAEERLTPATRAALDEVIGTRRLAQVSDWPDFVRAERAWSFAGPWHYVTVEDDQELSAVLARARETLAPDNVVEAIEYLTRVLRGTEPEVSDFAALLEKEEAPRLDDSVDATAVAFLVHLVGDLHQPLHVGRGGDRGGNQITVNFHGEQKNLHSVWDSALIDREDLSYTEFAAFLEQEFEGRDADWSGGAAADWAAESRRLRYEVYEIWRRTDESNHLPDLSWRYSYDHIGIVKQRLFQAGVRLAALLNSIFGGE